MKIAADTNILLRAIVGDDREQRRLAQAALEKADVVALPMPALCEFVWVLRRRYGVTAADAATAVRGLLSADNVITNYPAAAAGLAQLDAGGDFADGVIAYEGAWLGADTFVSFDREAVKLLEQRGVAARLLS